MGNVKVEHEGLCKNLLILSSEFPVPGVGGTYIERFFLHRPHHIELSWRENSLLGPWPFGADLLSGGSGICICDGSSILLPGPMLAIPDSHRQG